MSNAGSNGQQRWTNPSATALMRPTTLTGRGGKWGADTQDFGVELSISWLAVRLTATSLVVTRR
jgi:hypothetical protein